MSDAQKSAGQPPSDDKELADLLDSSLKDFGKARNTDDDLDELMAVQDQEAAKRAAADFQTMLQQMMTVQEEAMKAASTEQGPEGGQPSTEEEEAKQMFDAMRQLIEKSGQVANAQSSEEFMQGLEALRGPQSPLEPFMAMLMQTLASKDVMYPPLKEIYDAYPKYLEENANTLDPETKGRYEAQYEVIGRICTEFEKQPDVVPPDAAVTASEAPLETSTDAAANTEEPVDMDNFETLGKLLVELQTLGYPPKELVGSLPPGWSTDDNGMPKVEDVTRAADACCLM